jgi:uncharacterized cupin superfamily protein
MTVETVIKCDIAKMPMGPAPINPGWILEGNPVARNVLLSTSADGAASSYMWDCTAGRFNWYYEAEESIYVIEGGVVLKDQAGVRRLSGGDVIVFPPGSFAEWHIETYIRKFALIRTPLPGPLVAAKRGYRYFKRLIGASGPKDAAPSMS